MSGRERARIPNHGRRTYKQSPYEIDAPRAVSEQYVTFAHTVRHLALSFRDDRRENQVLAFACNETHLSNAAVRGSVYYSTSASSFSRSPRRRRSSRHLHVSSNSGHPRGLMASCKSREHVRGIPVQEQIVLHHTTCSTEIDMVRHQDQQLCLTRSWPQHHPALGQSPSAPPWESSPHCGAGHS